MHTRHMSGRARRCVWCQVRLPRQSSPRRRYCSPACVARAYRARARRRERVAAMAPIAAALINGEKPVGGCVLAVVGRSIRVGGSCAPMRDTTRPPAGGAGLAGSPTPGIRIMTRRRYLPGRGGSRSDGVRE